MSGDLKWNKIMGACLGTAFVILVVQQVSGMVYSTKQPEKMGYFVDAPEESAGGEPAALPIDWGTVLPTADIKAGEAVFAKCKSCHTIEAGGPNGTGPNLHGILGKKSGQHAGFAYSPAMIEHGTHGVWTFQETSEFLKAPQKHLPGTKMTFVGLKKAEDRINLLAYLNTQGSNLPFPAPNPAAAAPAAEGAAPATPAADAAAAPASAGAAPTAAATDAAPAAAN